MVPMIQIASAAMSCSQSLNAGMKEIYLKTRQNVAMGTTDDIK